MIDPQLIAEAIQALGMRLWVFHPDTGVFEDFGIFNELGHHHAPTSQQAILELVHPDDQHTFSQALAEHLSGDSERLNIDIRIKSSQGAFFWRSISGAIVQSENSPRKILGFAQDIHERRLKEEKLQQLATKDNLSGAYNKTMGMVLFERLRNQCAKNTIPIRIILLEVPNLKALNDMHGIDAGNKLILALNQIIREQMNPADLLFRLEGVSFLLVQPGQDESTMPKFTGIVDNKVQEYNVRNNNEYALTYRWGFAESHKPGADTAENLLARARQNLNMRGRSRS